MKYLLGIDFGGGASKATLIHTNGNIVAENTVEYPTLYPENGACEQDPKDWIDALCENSKAIIQKGGINAGEIAAIALDSATHTSLVCDENFEPLYNAMHWTDTRSRKEADALRESEGEFFTKINGKEPVTRVMMKLMSRGPKAESLPFAIETIMDRNMKSALTRRAFPTFTDMDLTFIVRIPFLSMTLFYVSIRYSLQ